jgi:glycosyltransferase involved in cell wall biosynthesis
LFLKHIATKSIPSDRMLIVAPSRWLLNRARQAPHLSRYEFRHIEYGIDLNTFRPLNKDQCRRRFNLPLDTRLIFIAAANLADRRKNFQLIIDLLKQSAFPSNALLVCAGKLPPPEELQQYEGLPVRFLGYLPNTEDMACVLSACDVSLILSKADNLPYVGIEASACGCPTIGTRAGGIPEIIQDGVTGWLIPQEAQVAELARMLHVVSGIDATQLAQYSHSARSRAEARYDIHDFVATYRDTFREVTERCASP